MTEPTPPAIDPSIAYLADAIERSAILQCAHQRLLLRHMLDYKFDPQDERVMQQCIQEAIQGRNIILGR